MDYSSTTYTDYATPEPKREFSFKRLLIKFFLWSNVFLIITVLPFTLMIRTAIYMYHQYNLPSSLGLTAGVIVLTFVLLTYLLIGYLLFFRKFKVSFVAVKRVTLSVFLLVVGYTVFALFSFTGENAKSDKVKQEYTELHPFLKISLRTLLFLDNDVLITSLSRTPEDYTKMGLSTKTRSLHYPQNTGYVHAMDLRTQGRPFWMIWFSQIYFNTLGFNIVRHDGTGDHLHVSLSTYERQGSW